MIANRGDRRAHLWLLLAAFGAACSQSDGILGRLSEGPSDDGGGQAGGVCSLASPVVTLPNLLGGFTSTCTGRLASSRFTSALCICNNLQLPNNLTTRGFDSSKGPYQAGTAADNSGAAVGINGTYLSSNSTTDVAGSFTVAGPGPLQFLGNLLVRGDLRVGGNLTVTGLATVTRDAWLAGNFIGLGTFIVGGRLVHTGAVTTVLLTVGSNQQQAVTISPPCPCEPSDLLDIAGLVANAKSDNDNNGLDPDVLASISGIREWTLPCGIIYLSQIAGTGDVVVHVNGTSALFIDGSINLQGSLTFQPTAGAELDVFVGQNLAVQGTLSLADKNRPAAGRISVGGSLPIALASPFVGNLYAPLARVTAATTLEVWGAIFASDLQASSTASFVFDRDIATVGTNCTAPLPPSGLCTQCEWCSGGAACVDGVCSICRSDSDCCGQTACTNGSCAPLID
jgi:hypothetical protein